jgi:hypothetical protein
VAGLGWISPAITAVTAAEAEAQSSQPEPVAISTARIAAPIPAHTQNGWAA